MITSNTVHICEYFWIWWHLLVSVAFLTHSVLLFQIRWRYGLCRALRFIKIVCKKIIMKFQTFYSKRVQNRILPVYFDFCQFFPYMAMIHFYLLLLAFWVRVEVLYFIIYLGRVLFLFVFFFKTIRTMSFDFQSIYYIPDNLAYYGIIAGIAFRDISIWSWFYFIFTWIHY